MRRVGPAIGMFLLGLAALIAVSLVDAEEEQYVPPPRHIEFIPTLWDEIRTDARGFTVPKEDREELTAGIQARAKEECLTPKQFALLVKYHFRVDRVEVCERTLPLLGSPPIVE